MDRDTAKRGKITPERSLRSTSKRIKTEVNDSLSVSSPSNFTTLKNLPSTSGSNTKSNCEVTVGQINQKSQVTITKTNSNNISDSDFSCCKKTFKKKASYYRHLKSHDEDNWKFVCCVCERRFYRSDSYKSHLIVNHQLDPNTLLKMTKSEDASVVEDYEEEDDEENGNIASPISSGQRDNSSISPKESQVLAEHLSPDDSTTPGATGDSSQNDSSSESIVVEPLIPLSPHSIWQCVACDLDFQSAIGLNNHLTEVHIGLSGSSALRGSNYGKKGANRTTSTVNQTRSSDVNSNKDNVIYYPIFYPFYLPGPSLPPPNWSHSTPPPPPHFQPPIMQSNQANGPSEPFQYNPWMMMPRTTVPIPTFPQPQ